ncbi:hypothetical protein SNEBB_002290 [Seison nebaliae]|nr:hypothetical protein SNEBB_002290 [Seison nebaliae]
MGQGKCQSLSKMILFIFNFLLFICGAVVCGLGIWARVDSKSFLDQITKFLKTIKISDVIHIDYLKSAALLLIIAGAILLLLGFLGCWGAYRESICLLSIYCTLIGLILLAELVGAILLFVMKSKVENVLKTEMKKQFNKQSTEIKEAFNAIQTELKCCGVDGSTDYGQDVPQSCYPTNNTITPYTEGCWKAIENKIKSNANSVGIAAIVTILVQIVSFTLGLITIIKAKNGASQYN